MEHGDTAQIAAVAGAVGAPLVLLARQRLALLAGVALLAVAEAGLARALLPLDELVDLARRPVGAAAIAFGVALVAVLGAGFARYPAAIPIAVAATAPLRVPVEAGNERAFLLIPLYGVLAAAVLAFGARALRGAVLPTLHPAIAVPAAAMTALAGASLLWTRDLRAGSIALAFFYFPFAVLVATVGRSPFRSWTPRALAATAIAAACSFAAIGLWQVRTRELFFAPDLEVANAYTSFFRVTSLFKDPSLYGRYLVIAIAVLVVALWLRRARATVVMPLVAFLFVGLFFSYSQSSFVALFAVLLALAFALGDRRQRMVVGAAAATCAVAGSAIAVAAASGHSLRDATSGRSRLVDVTVQVAAEHPIAGVGIGSQPRASTQAAGGTSVRRHASHTTPLTVAAELGALGVAAYAAFLAGVAVVLLAAARRERALGVGLAAVFTVLVVHSLVYSGFFEDPVTWAVPAVASALLVGRATTERAFAHAAGAPARGAIARAPAEPT